MNGVAKSLIRLSDFNFTFHFDALEKEMATHFSVLAWRIPGTRGAWWATVYGVSQSRTRLKRPRSCSAASHMPARPHLPSFTTNERALIQRQRRRHHALPDGGPCLSQARSWNNIPSCATQEQAGRMDTLAGITAGGWGKPGLPTVWELTSDDSCQPNAQTDSALCQRETQLQQPTVL